jgi:hypothetical protein
MGIYRGLSRRARIALVVTAVALATAGSAAAFQALPPGAQVNDDVAAGINPAQSVDGGEPTNADVVGGSLVATKPAVPWSIFRQGEAGGAHDQIFSRSFANGAWLTRGNGTVGGRSSASPTFSGSLNFDQGQDGEAPSIDFAGAGRTVPWATWYENTAGAGFGNNNVFASRFDAAQNKWVFAGQGRGTGGVGSVAVPSLNIHTDQNAENPSVAGGSAADPTKPGPWVTWQETTSAPVNGKDQIFVSKPLGPGMANCDAPVTPAGVADGTGHVPAIGGFCFQQVGLGRVGPGGADPSLNVDVKRDGVEPDIAFTGANDSVPWVVWYEQNAGTTGLAPNDMVFAAKAEADGTAGAGGFHWHVIGNTGNGILNAANSCAGSLSAEQACSLNKNAASDAENPRVAAGTMNPANPTVPWVAWDEDLGGVKQVFVSRLVGTPSPHFELVNNGAPISVGANDSTRPDITFSGNTPYVSWREDTGGGVEKAFVGHFVNAANPTFVLDESDVPLTPTAQADVREPISSTCIATPFNMDGQSCQGGAVGTPFFLFTNGTSPRGLFADAYQPDVPVTGAASGITTSAATVSGTVNPEGAAVRVHFDFGTSTAYGQSTATQTVGVGNAPAAFTAALSGLPAGTTVHYRAVASSDFGTFTGADQTLTTNSVTNPPAPGATITVGHAKMDGKTVAVKVTCSGAPCQVMLNLSTRGLHHKQVRVGATSVTLQPGQTRVVRIGLNQTGRHLLAARHVLKVTLRAIQSLDGGHTSTISTQAVILKIHGHKHH